MKTNSAKKTVYAIAYKDGSVSSKMFDTEDEAQAFIASLSPSKKREVHSIFARDVKRSDHTEGERERRERHTPTPWLWREELDGSFVIETDAPIEEMREVAQGLIQADAAFIVRAVNGHEALLRLVKRHREWIKRQDVPTAEDRDWARSADQIIAQDEGKGK
jgi:hypothetical protein